MMQAPVSSDGMLRDAPPPNARSLPAILDAQAARLGDARLATIAGHSISFAECRDHAARFAGTLRAAGIRPGDRVALMCRNRIEFAWAWLGILWAGAIAVPLNTALRGAQLTHVLVNSGTRLLLVDGDLAAHLAEVRAPDLAQVWLLDQPAAVLPETYSFAPLPPLGEAFPMHANAPGEVTAIIYTSGTTGPSKGVMYPPDQMYWWAAYMNIMMRVGAGDVPFTVLPMFHINALATLVQCLIAGTRCVIMERFSASRYWEQAAEAGATHTYLIGAMGGILLAQAPGRFDREHKIRTVLASSIRSNVWAEFPRRFGVVRRVGGYGATESNAVFFAEDGWETQGYMGRPAAGFHAQVVDQNDEIVPDGKIGELVLRSDVPFAFATGYWGAPEATVAAWRNLWLHTGDLVTRNSDGVFRFVGRLKESIRRRGENISAWEVEQALLSHASILDAAAFGVPSDLGDEDVMATLVLKDGQQLAPEDLLRHLDGRLAYFAIPRYIEFLPELPLTENGKIKRTELRQRGVTAATWDREAAGYKISRATR
jgi:crotonobetaine/carnitine-CoA ligase